jgi:hypothetical protein
LLGILQPGPTEILLAITPEESEECDIDASQFAHFQSGLEDFLARFCLVMMS